MANFRVVSECSGGLVYDAPKCAPLFDLLAQRRVWQTPTLAFFMNVADLMSGRLPPAAAYASPGLRELWRHNAEASALNDEAKRTLTALGAATLAAIPDMRRRGVRFLAGCDGLVPGFCLHDELEWMTKAGMTPTEALRTATTGPAEFLGRSATLGAVKPGYRADLVLLERNPLQDIRNTRAIAAVVVRGQLVGAAERDRLLRAAQTPRPR
jgi:hypothetical protein